MVNTTNHKKSRPAAPGKTKVASGDCAFAAWRAFFDKESAKILAQHPGLKYSTLQKRVSKAYQRHKEEVAARDRGRAGTANGQE